MTEEEGPDHTVTAALLLFAVVSDTQLLKKEIHEWALQNLLNLKCPHNPITHLHMMTQKGD